LAHLAGRENNVTFPLVAMAKNMDDNARHAGDEEVNALQLPMCCGEHILTVGVVLN